MTEAQVVNNNPDMEEEEEVEAPVAPPTPRVIVTLLSDTRGSQPVDIAGLQATLNGVSVTVRNVLGLVGVEPGGTAQIYINNNAAGLDSTVAEGDAIYVAGKLAGGC
jgi:hypothetical protein